jgi:hypothetical protein
MERARAQARAEGGIGAPACAGNAPARASSATNHTRSIRRQGQLIDIGRRAERTCLLHDVPQCCRPPQSILLLANQNHEGQQQRTDHHEGVEQHVDRGAHGGAFCCSLRAARQKCGQCGLSVGFLRHSCQGNGRQRSEQRGVRPRTDHIRMIRGRREPQFLANGEARSLPEESVQTRITALWPLPGCRRPAILCWLICAEPQPSRPP